MDHDLSRSLTEFVEEVESLRHDLQQRHELDKYEARFARIRHKQTSLTEHIFGGNSDLAKQLIEFVEKVGLLRRDMQLRKELDKYEARFARIDQKFSALAEQISRDNPDLAKQLRAAWQMPARSLAFRNADHQKNRE